ncbi:hypothetical protein PG994_001664 [Apiospora phragmitis]|uniref:Protamine P1 n=1 Tax=Apiospora phragmitis TaxID=2905665 RepID=A0ABR1WU85_9PEZI
MDMNWWEQAQPREEPLHCAAPQNPEDILYPGSDDGLDDATKAAKRRRYEEKDGSWQNPWLPRNGPLPSSSRPTITKPAVKASMRRNVHKLEGKANSTPETRGSMRCHLPSPESNRDLQLDDYDNLDPDKRSRIQSWASNVTAGALEKDSFWAPAQAKSQTPDHVTNKRHAGNNWLKSKLSKRSKSDHPSLGSLMTPTPAISSESIRETSPPSFAISQEALDMTQQPPHSNLDTLTNPSGAAQRMTQFVEELSQTIAESSSGLEQPPAPHSSTKDLNPMSLIPSDANILNQLPASNENYSETSSELSSLWSSEVTPACPIQPMEQAGDLLPNLETANTFSGSIEEVTASGHSHVEEADSQFESHLDQSFHYKTRPVRKDAPRPVTAEPAATVPLSQPTQTGTPISEKHQDYVTFKARQTLKDKVDTVFSHSENSISTSERSSQFGTKTPSVVGNEGDRGKGYESRLPTNEDITILDQPITLATMESMLKNGDTTLVADAMDVDGQLDNASFFHPAGKIRYGELSVEKPVSTNSPISLEGEKRGMTDNASPRHEFDGEETAVHILLSQMEWSVRERETNSPTCSFFAAVEPPQSPFLCEAAENAAGNIDQQVLDNNIQQELLAMEAQPDAAESILHIKTEPDEELCALATSHNSMTDLPSIVLDQSVLGPSQQSPWGTVNADTSLEVKDEFQATNRGVPQPEFITSPKPTSQLPSQQQSPWGGIDAQAAIRPYGSISVSSLLNVSPQWPRSQPDDTPSNLLRSRVSFASQPSDTLNSFLRDCVSSGSVATPQAAQAREETPEPELSVKSFAKFNTPSPKRRPRGYKHPRLSGSRLPSTQVLVNATDGNPWGTQRTRSNRRVSFAPLPCEEKDVADMTSSQAPPRPASPPPAITPGADDDDTDHRFRKHFDAVASRGGHPSKVGIQERLLPSESQQKPMSPEVGAMAEAFREADNFHTPDLLGHRASPFHEDTEAPPVDSYHDDEPAIDAPQSPWQEESQGLDDVAEVMQNLDDFLNPHWGEESDLGMAL